MSPVRGYFHAVRRPAPPRCAPHHEENPIATLASAPTVPRDDRPQPRRLAKEPSAVERWTIAVLLLWLLVGPRIELVAGARVEDLVFAAIAVLCLLHARLVVRPAGPSLAIAGVAVAGLISALVATARGTVDPVTAVLYAVRPLEYWIAFPAALLLLRGAHGAWGRRVEVLLMVVTVLQTAFAVAQYYFGLRVGFSHASYARAAGLTVGPYELGAISAALVVYWVSRGRFTMASLAAIALAASISRVSLLAAAAGLVLLLAFWGVRLGRRIARRGWRAALPAPARSRVRVVGQVLSVTAAVLVLGSTLGVIHLPAAAPQVAPPAVPDSTSSASTDASEAPDDTATTPPSDPSDAAPVAGPSDSIAQRLATTSIVGSWFAAQSAAERVPPIRDSTEYADIAYARWNQYVNPATATATGVEASNLVRFFRWHLILNTIDEPTEVVLGLGPSFVGPSVDGSYLRFFADGGVLGVLAWLALVVMWLRRAPLWMVCVTLTVLVGGLFIDIVYAQRPMVLFWMLLAIAATRTRAADDAVAEQTDLVRV